MSTLGGAVSNRCIHSFTLFHVPYNIIISEIETEKGCYVQHSEDILYENGCVDMYVDVQVNGESVKVLESRRLCLCEGMVARWL